MRITKLTAKRFGLLKDFTCDIDAPLVVIKGLNESGKSTTFELLLSLLFGYENDGTKRSFKLLPKVLPWSGETPKIEGLISLEDGQKFGVIRDFEKNKPLDSMLKNGRSVSLNTDENLPSLGTMTRDTYKTMYALDLTQMTHLKKNWEEIRERLLGGLYPPYLKSYKKVEQDIQDRMRTIWKDERATKHSKDLEKKIAETKLGIAELRKKQHDMRDMEITIGEHRQRVQQLEEDLRYMERAIQQKRKDKRVAGALKVILHLERRAGDINRYKDVPEHPMEYYKRQREIANTAGEKIRDLKREADRLTPSIRRFDDRQQSMLDHKESIQDLRIKQQNLNNLRKQMDTNRNKIAKLSAEIASMADELLVSTRGNWKEVIGSLDLASLKSVVESYDHYDHLRLEQLGLAPDPKDRKPLPWKAIGGFVLIGAAVAMVLMNQPLIGAGMGLGGIALWVIAAVNRNRRRIEMERHDTEFDRDLATCVEAWRRHLQRVPLPEEWLERPDSRSYERIRQLKSQITIEADEMADMKQLEQSCINAENVIKEQVRELLGREVPSVIGIAQLEEALDRANELSSKSQTAKTELKFIEDRLQEEQRREKEAKDAIQELTNKLRAIGEGGTEDNIGLLMERRKSAAEARRRRRDLEVQYTDFEAVEKRATKLLEQDFDFDENEEVEKMNAVERELTELRATRTQMETKLGMLVKNGETPANMEAELLALEEEKRQRIYQRDQLALALTLIKTGREQFMEHHRPQFLENAQGYLSVITGGRYSRIALDESGEDFVIDLDGTQARGAKEFSDKLSQGTLEQVYMALRLAMLDQLDPSGERLPLILDEVLVNWDRDRLGNFNDVLKDVMKKRQVILFTCHDYMADVLDKSGLKPLVVSM